MDAQDSPLFFSLVLVNTVLVFFEYPDHPQIRIVKIGIWTPLGFCGLLFFLSSVDFPFGFPEQVCSGLRHHQLPGHRGFLRLQLAPRHA